METKNQPYIIYVVVYGKEYGKSFRDEKDAKEYAEKLSHLVSGNKFHIEPQTVY